MSLKCSLELRRKLHGFGGIKKVNYFNDILLVLR